MPNSDYEEVAQLFKSRDSQKVIQGYAALLEMQTDRIERGMRLEASDEEKGVDNALTKLIDSTMDRAEKLAKLLDPALRATGSKVQIAINGAQHAEIGDSRSAGAWVIAQLEEQGIPREKITKEMITDFLAASYGESTKYAPRAIEAPIEGTVVE